MGLGIDISSTGGAGTPGILKVSDEVARLLLSPSPGDWAVQIDDGTLWYYNGTYWELRSKEDPILEIRDSSSIALTTEVTIPPYDDDIPSHDTKVFAELKLSVVAPDAANLAVTRDIQLDGLRTQIPVSSVRSVLSATAPVAYDSATGIVSMAQATNANDGYMDSTHVSALEGVITDLNNHLSDTTDAHDASAISATGTYSDVQAAITGIETSVSDHLADTTDAHDASAISATGTYSDVQAAITGIETSVSDHLADTTDAHDASAISYVNTTSGLTATTAQAALDEVDQKIDDHIADTTAAHAASAVSFAPPTNYTSTDVQAAIIEYSGFKQTTVYSPSNGGIITVPDLRKSLIRVEGFGGPVSSVTVAHTNLVDGDEVIFVGNNSSNYVGFGNTATFKFNGTPILSLYDTIHFIKVGGILVEIARSV